MKKNAILIILTAVLMVGCQTTMLEPTNPVCDQPEFADSWICSQLRAHGVEHAEIIRDLILDANDISLVMEVYTTSQLEASLDRTEGLLDIGPMSYTMLLTSVAEDTKKAVRVGSIISRHLQVLKSPQFIRKSDRELIRMAVAELRRSIQ